MLGMPKDPYPESPNVAEDPGDGVKIGGEKPDDWDSIGDCSKVSTKGKISYCKNTVSHCPNTVSGVRKRRDPYSLGQGAGIQVDGSKIEEVNSDDGQLILLGSIANDWAKVSILHFNTLSFQGDIGRANALRTIGIDKILKLLGSQSRLELQRSAQERLGDGERGAICGSHCK